MALPSPQLSRCAICGLALTAGPTIPATSCGQVHLRCAERQARAAVRRRRIRAVSTAAVLAGVVIVMVGLGRGGWGMVLVLALCMLAHVRINRRWWEYTFQSVRWWLRMRG